MLNYDCKYNTEKPLCQGFWGKKILHAIVKWLNMTKQKGQKGEKGPKRQKRPRRPRDHRDQEKSRTAVDSIFSLVPCSLWSLWSLSLPITLYHTTPPPVIL